MTAIGVLGGGQLGRMLALAGYPLGLRFRFLDPAPEAPVEQLAELMVGRFDDLEVLSRFPRDLQVITLEFENVPVESARHLARTNPLFPPPLALEISQDRLLEKKTFSAMGLVPAPFHPVDSRDDLVQAVATIGLPGILKTRKLGYDGKGQVPIRAEKDIEMAWSQLGGVPLIYEGFVPFDRELSQISVRGRDGAIVHYPLVWNTHEGGILRLTRAPALYVSESLAATARRGMQAMMEHLDYVGVLAIEFFQVGDRLVANEMAPRVHNSGHWTIEGARTSQFENHLRAVVGWPLGEAEAVGHSAMVNLIGRLPEPEPLLAIPGVHLHFYGKASRPGRKVGHLTLWADTPGEVDDRLKRVHEILS